MLIYFTCFFLSCFFIGFSEWLSMRGIRFAGKVFVFFGLLAPCLLAGFRDVGVGTDTAGYGIWLYELADSSVGAIDYFNEALLGSRSVEPLFAALAFVAAKLTHSVFWYFFFIEALIVVPVYFALSQVSAHGRTWFAMLVYYLVFYAVGLNAMRQMIAASFLLLAGVSLMAQHKCKYWIYLIVACVSHYSGMLGLLLLPIWGICSRFSGSTVVHKEKRAFCVAVFLAGGLVLLLLGRQLLSVCFALVPSLSRYAVYLDISDSTYGVSFYVFYGAIFGLLLVSAKWAKMDFDTRRKAFFCALIVLASFLLYAAGSIATVLTRLSYFALLYVCPLLLLVLKERVQSSVSVLAALLLSAVCVVQFLWYYCFNGYNEVYPYVSAALGIG